MFQSSALKSGQGDYLISAKNKAMAAMNIQMP